MKSEIESRIFTSKTALAAEHIPNLDDCPVKVFLPMCYFVPFYGNKLKEALFKGLQSQFLHQSLVRFKQVGVKKAFHAHSGAKVKE